MKYFVCLLIALCSVSVFADEKDDQKIYDQYYIVKFTAHWCGPCQVWERVESKDLKVKYFSIDIDKYPRFIKKFGVDSIPAFYICRKSDNKYFLDKSREQKFGFSRPKGYITAKSLEERTLKLHKLVTETGL